MIQDILTVGLLGLAVWYVLIPRTIRQGITMSLGPMIGAVADGLRHVIRSTESAARGLIVGESVKHYQSSYVEHKEDAGSLQSGTRYQSVPDTYQPEPASSEPVRTSSEPLISDELALARHFATLQKPNGEYWLSANKIAAAVGGERESILAAIREIRGRQPIPGERVLRVKDAKGERAISWEA